MTDVHDIKELTIAINAVTKASIRLVSQPKVTRPIEIAMDNLFQRIEDIEVQAFMRGEESAKKKIYKEEEDARQRHQHSATFRSRV